MRESRGIQNPIINMTDRNDIPPKIYFKKHSLRGASLDRLELCKDPEGHRQVWPRVGGKRL